MRVFISSVIGGYGSYRLAARTLAVSVLFVSHLRLRLSNRSLGLAGLFA